MSMKALRQFEMFNALRALIKEHTKARAAGLDPDDETYGLPRNRAERRNKIRGMSRQLRVSVHGFGQGIKKVVDADGMLARP